jgi:hypothetical protein
MPTLRRTTPCKLLGSSAREGQTIKEAAGKFRQPLFYAGQDVELRMRALIAVAAVALTISACGDKAADGGANISENVAAEAIYSNDTTAIDAATGDASNMAADVAYTVNSIEADGDDAEDGRSTRNRSRRSTASESDAAPNDAGNAGAEDTAVDSNGV